MPIILSKLTPQYPSIGEIEFGYTLDEFAQPMVIYRHFQESEIKFKTLNAWKNLRKLLIQYYKSPDKTHREQLDTNISGEIINYKDKKAIQLTDNKTRVLLFPRTITELAEKVYDSIDESVFELFKSNDYAKSLITNFINIFQYRNLVSGLIEFDKKTDNIYCHIYQSLVKKADLVYQIAKKRNFEDFETPKKKTCLKKCSKDLFK